MKAMKKISKFSFVSPVILCFGLIAGGVLIIAEPNNLNAIIRGFLIIIFGVISSSFLNYYLTLDLLKRTSEESMAQIIHLFAAHTLELRGSIETQFASLKQCIEVQAECSRKINKNLEKDLVILSDIMDKDIKTVINTIKEK